MENKKEIDGFARLSLCSNSLNFAPRMGFYGLAYTVGRVNGFCANLGKIEGAVYLGFVTIFDYGQRSTQRNGQRKPLKIKGFIVVIVQGMDNGIANTFPTNKKVRDIYYL